MSNHKLFVDRRVTTNGRKSQIKMDNAVAIHTFIETTLSALPEHAGQAAAVTAGLVSGDVFWDVTAPATPLLAKVA
jgi:hypothetical protein